MAADTYYGSGDDNPYATNTSNGDGDWWTQNQPPPPPPTGEFKGPGVYVNPDGSYVGQNGKLYDAQGNEITKAVKPTIGPATTQGPGAPIGDTAAPSPTWGGPVAGFDQGANPYPTFAPPPLPASLQRDFQLPSAAELQATPGYMERFQMGQKARERSAAARGTILNGGTQQALTKYGQDYASGEYNNLAQQKLGERQQQSQDYLNLAYGPAWQSNAAAVNQYGTLYNQYRNLIGDNRTAQNDYWQQQMDLLNAGLGAAKSGSPGSTGGQG